MTQKKFLKKEIMYQNTKIFFEKRNYVSKYIVYLYFLTSQNFLISSEKMLTPAELNQSVT